jgi:hypothetical protein
MLSPTRAFTIISLLGFMLFKIVDSQGTSTRKSKPILLAECYSGGHIVYMDLIHDYLPSPSGILLTPVAGEPHVFVTGSCVISHPEE